MSQIRHAQDRVETLFEDWHLDGDMGEVIVDLLVRGGADGGVEFRVFVVVCDRTDANDARDDVGWENERWDLGDKRMTYAMLMFCTIWSAKNCGSCELSGTRAGGNARVKRSTRAAGTRRSQSARRSRQA
jgi:hypothetical protein